VEGQGVRVEASVATMVEMSDVGDVALVEVVGSSSTCSWVCLGLFVAVKSKLQWRVLDDGDRWSVRLSSTVPALPLSDYVFNFDELLLVLIGTVNCP
jgi:hypothetical protein